MPNWIETDTGVALPAPLLGSSGLTISTLVDGGRNVQGTFVGSVIGGDKLSIDIEFPSLSPDEMYNFLRLFDRNHGGKFIHKFRVYDPREKDWVIKEMYIGDRTGTPMLLDSRGVPTGWTDVKSKLVEV